MEGEAGGDVQEPVAQALGLAALELAGEEQSLGPGDQVVREADDLKPDAVVLEVAKRQISVAGVLVVSDVILDAGAAAMITLQCGDRAGVVGEDRLEAMPVVVGERELRAGVGALAPDDHPGPGRPGVEVQSRGDFCDLPVRALGAVLVKRRNPALVDDLCDRGADSLGQVIADRVTDVGLVAPVQQFMAGAGAVDAEPQLDRRDVTGRDLRERLLDHLDPARRELMPDWERGARRLVAKFRADSARHIGDPAFDQLISSLRAGSEDFRTWWERHEVAGGGEGRKELLHPVVGKLVFEHAVFRHEASDQRLVLYSPLGEQDTPAKLAELLAEPVAA